VGAAARLILLAGAAAAIAGGCAPKVAPGRAGAPRQVRTSQGPRETVTRPKQRTSSGTDRGAPAALPAEDECAARLHDIGGLLLEYFLVNKRLPDRLEDLAPLADPGTDFQTTCPVSGRPYVYVPAGLSAPGSGRVLMVYDAVPDHAGIRWGLTASPAQGDQPLSTWVMPLTEERLRRYVPKPGG
jgi:hypothetical protein